MELDAKLVFDVLQRKGLTYLYHSNTTRTSKTFLENKALLSRAYNQRNGLPQSPQKSDEKDRRYDIFNYIFLDAIKVNEYYKHYNYYGPVLFIFNLDLLNDDKIPTVRISKNNPIYWEENDKPEDKYFQTIKDYETSFYTGNRLADAGNHIIITCLDGKLSLLPHLIGIHIDNPGLTVRDSSDNQIKDYAKAIFDYFHDDINDLGIENLDLKKISNRTYQIQYRNKYDRDNNDFKRLFNK